MKTQPMSQQLTALERMDGRRWYALFMEQGTGKTWSFLADAQRYHERGKIDGLLVFAPNGVHTNWVRREIPAHMEDDRVVAAAWKSNATGARKKLLKAILAPQPQRLRVLTMNYESLRGQSAREQALAFLQSGRMMCVLDESHRIQDPGSLTTKEIMKLRPHMVAVRIGSGTPMDKPEHIFAQFEFMHPGLLGTENYRAFMAEYAVLADWKNPKTGSDWAMKRQVEAHPRMAWATIVARDDVTGRPMYKNLDRLNALIAEHSYRVLKKDCLDLPEKVYTSIYFDLTPEQERAYELMESELRIQLEDGTASSVSALSSLVKLQQITSGYVMVPGREEPMYIPGGNPRIEAVVRYVTDVVRDGKVIVWCRFREEVAALTEALSAAGRRVVQYHGDVKEADREAAIDNFQNGTADAFVGIQKAGKEGLTLTAALWTVFCSNEWSARDRNQAEDRNHRKGTHGEVTYADVVAPGTVDEAIARAHQWKTDLAATILGDRGLDLRRFL